MKRLVHERQKHDKPKQKYNIIRSESGERKANLLVKNPNLFNDVVTWASVTKNPGEVGEAWVGERRGGNY